MALTEYNMLPLGTRAPGFTLMDTISGENLALEELQSDKATVIMFICNHCPYVLHVNPEIIRVAHDYIPLGVSFIAISSNDIERYPADRPEKMQEFAKEHKFPFVYLYDENQDVAKAYDAACTPDFYVFNGDLRLVYRGRLDQSRPKAETPLTGEDLRAAIVSVLSGNQINEKQYPSAGCSIKWKR
ncbi:MAG: thioredoxin family protein [Saprospiraceae bacterium]